MAISCKGEFALVRLKNAENNAWLLIKHRDEFAKPTDVTRKVRSVISDKTIEEVEKASDHIYGQNKSAKRELLRRRLQPQQKGLHPKVFLYQQRNYRQEDCCHQSHFYEATGSLPCQALQYKASLTR